MKQSLSRIHDIKVGNLTIWYVVYINTYQTYMLYKKIKSRNCKWIKRKKEHIIIHKNTCN